MQRIILILIFAICAGLVLAQDGYRITVKTAEFDQGEVYLGFYLGESQYVQDTARSEDGVFVFKGDEPLAPGFYMVVFPPDNMYSQILVGEGENDIKLEMNGANLQRPESVAGSPDTDLYYDYADFISSRRPEADKLRNELETASDKRKKEINARLEQLNEEVEERQQQILLQHPGTLTAMVIKSNMALDVPDFEGTDEEQSDKLYAFYKRHYFDNIDLSDPRIVRTPFFKDKLGYYLDKLTYQKSDSIIESVDFILGQMNPEEENFRVVLSTLLNKYATSKIVGMDAVYVHIVDEYYARGLATWVEEEQLTKIVKNANTLRPILIGKTAPDLKLLAEDKSEIRLHSIDAAYTVLYFWDPECGHCKKSIPKVMEFYEQYKNKGVEVLAVCTKLGDDADSCWEAIEERGMDIWVNAYDPYLRSRFKQIYDVRSTPQVFVLDADKKIIMKRIGAEQLPEVLKHFMNNP